MVSSDSMIGFPKRNMNKRKRALQKHLSLLVFYGPSLAVLLAFLIIPILLGFGYSFTDWNGVRREIHYLGLTNYARIFSQEAALMALKNTLLVCFFVTLITNVLALLLAIILDSSIRARNVFRTLFYIPSILMPLVVGFTWTYIYSARNGALNTILQPLGLISGNVAWLGDPRTVLFSVILTICWQALGYYMVIYLAGLQTIPIDLIDAAVIDGAGPIKSWLFVKLPLLAPSITICVVLATIGSLKTFDIIWAMTKGGPGHFSETLTTLIYSEAFREGKFAYSTAVSVVLTLVVLVLTLVQLQVLKRREVQL